MVVLAITGLSGTHGPAVAWGPYRPFTTYPGAAIGQQTWVTWQEDRRDVVVAQGLDAEVGHELVVHCPGYVDPLLDSRGADALSAAIAAARQQFPDWRFRLTGTVDGHHRLTWALGCDGEPAQATGFDVLVLALDGRIAEDYGFWTRSRLERTTPARRGKLHCRASARPDRYAADCARDLAQLSDAVLAGLRATLPSVDIG